MEGLIEKNADTRKSDKIHIINSDCIATINKAIDTAKQDRADLLVITSDISSINSITNELIKVAYADPMIGFATPRHRDIAPQHLPNYCLIPACTAACLFIKAKIIGELGHLDADYESLHAAIQDYIMRANQFGYRVAEANKIYLQQKNYDLMTPLLATDQARLTQRYREYTYLISSYNQSPEKKALDLLQSLTPDEQGQIAIGFELSRLNASFNGTAEATIKLIQAADKVWPQHYKFIVFCPKTAWEYHEFGQLLSSRVIRGDIEVINYKLAAMITIGQPFNVDELKNVIYNAPINAFRVLDCIATDCGYIRQTFDENYWRFIMNWSDIIFSISDYTASQFLRRYPIGSQVLLCSSLLSITPNEYLIPVPPMQKKSQKKSILLIGNHYAHKGLNQYVLGLAEQFPDMEFTVLGDDSYQLSNVRGIKSGAIPIHEVALMYSQTDAIIFPSHYEGFGFPFLNSLAYQKPIFLRDVHPYPEILEKIEIGKENVYFFSSLDELISQLKSGIPDWIGPVAQGEVAGWNRHAQDILQALESKIATISMQAISERIRWFELAFRPSLQPIIQFAHHRATEKCIRLMKRIKRKMGFKVS